MTSPSRSCGHYLNEYDYRVEAERIRAEQNLAKQEMEEVATGPICELCHEPGQETWTLGGSLPFICCRDAVQCEIRMKAKFKELS